MPTSHDSKTQQEACQLPLCEEPTVSYRMCADHYRRWRRTGDPYAHKLTHRGRALKAFIDAAVCSETDECIIWPYAKTSSGYGMFCDASGKKHMATRVVAERFYGQAPSQNHVVAHKPVVCHNPSCVNPRHLRWATHKENSADMELDQTRRRGERSSNSKLTAEIVLSIRASNERGCDLAKRYGVSQATISLVRHRKVWGHI